MLQLTQHVSSNITITPIETKHLLPVNVIFLWVCICFFSTKQIFSKNTYIKTNLNFEFNFVKSEHIDIKSNYKKRKHTVVGYIFIRFKAEHISRRTKNVQAKDLDAFESPSRNLHENFLQKAIANSENCNAQQSFN